MRVARTAQVEPMDATAKVEAVGKAVNAPTQASTREKTRKGTLRGVEEEKRAYTQKISPFNNEGGSEKGIRDPTNPPPNEVGIVCLVQSRLRSISRRIFFADPLTGLA